MIDLRSSWRVEFAPTPNRLPRAAIIALLCGIVVMTSKALSLPETALSAYLIFFASKENASLSVLTGIGMMVAGMIGICIVIPLIMISAGAPMLRILIMFSITFGCMYLARATSAGIIAATLGMVFFELLSVLDYIPSPDLALRGIVWLIPIIVVPMGLLVIASLLMGPSAIDALGSNISRRLKLIRSAIATRAPDEQAACRAEFLEGGASLDKLQHIAKLTGRLTPKNEKKATHLQDVTTQLLGRCATGTATEATADRLLQDPTEDADPVSATTQTPDNDDVDYDVSPGRSSNAIRFAIKATLSVAICYAILTLLNWPAIHTITITAFLVSLGSTSDTLHKVSLRLTGCLIGAVISLFCIIVIIPHLTHASELAVLTMIIAFPAAWIAVGRENSAYIGMQIALVFFLSVLNTSGPSPDVSIAWGRIVGVVLGNLVVATVFLSLWPHSSIRFIEQSLNRALKILEKNLHPGTRQGISLGKACDALVVAGEGITKIQQGWGLGKATTTRAKHLHKIHADLESIALTATHPENADTDSQLQHLEKIRANLDFASCIPTAIKESH